MSLKERIRKLLVRFEELLRFLVVGIINWIFAALLFALLLWLLTPPVSHLALSHAPVLHLIGAHSYAAIQWISWALGVPFGTFMMRRFVFNSPGSYPKQVLRAYGVYLPAQLVSSGILIFCVQVLGFLPIIGQLIATACSTVVSYLGHKFFTFRAPSQ